MRPILVTEPEFTKATQIFQSSGVTCSPSAPSEADLCAAIQQHNARHAIVGIHTYRSSLYEALQPGSVLARFGVGHDGIDKTRATRAGILCTNTPGVLNESVAEHTISLLLAAARHTTRVAAAMSNRLWAPVGGRELRGKTLAIIGCGPIGSAVARIATAAFDMRVLGVIQHTAPPEPGYFTKLTNDPVQALSQADFVSLHIPATPANAHFMNQQRLALLPPGAWLINTARGAVVDESAVYDALVQGTLAGAALDVFETEPYVPVDPDKDLRTLPNTVLTPHIGSNTADANARMAQQALHNIILAEAGAFEQMNLLNPEVLKTLPRHGNV
ncbi:NAD(P)-dependent oxidoreductase [uncultured Paludibaculum sp.]|uniref:NAD(P)-dependent oxidoreductase n=1 Tax=uncultured Paludibaculum sp. TaxID=1765020 RepID=UPI002AAB2227|nr:NAD(P)-dependent oxidoreductase [uncultured Paludibaculum sp.]